jgi:RNA methyltransferase, TrmH family
MGPGNRRELDVESPSNPTVRMLRELHSRDGREQHGAFLVEGTRLVAEAVASSWPIIAALYDPERAGEDAQLASIVAAIPNALRASPRALKMACDTVTPQGIVAAVRLPAPPSLVDPEEPIVLILDGISDPGNAGTLLRSAAGAGVRTVLATQGSVDIFSPKVVRGGMGAHFRLKLAEGLSWTELLAALDPGRALVVAQMDSDTPYFQFDWHSTAALVVGSESRGPSRKALEKATATVSIPLEQGVESLNAAVAGSIILFEAKRQRASG